MDRVVIVGCGGSGKTTLARELAGILDAPLTHLDAVYYDKRWTPASPDQFLARQREIVAGPRWVIEGNYASTLPVRLAAADTVVFLDLPAAACLWGVLRRRSRYGGGQHADGVHDRITWGFVRYIVGYRRSMRPRVRRLLREHGRQAHVITLTSRRRTTRWIDRVRRERHPTGR